MFANSFRGGIDFKPCELVVVRVFNVYFNQELSWQECVSCSIWRFNIISSVPRTIIRPILSLIGIVKQSLLKFRESSYEAYFLCLLLCSFWWDPVRGFQIWSWNWKNKYTSILAVLNTGQFLQSNICIAFISIHSVKHCIVTGLSYIKYLYEVWNLKQVWNMNP
jgi:hypothetical protein